MPIGGFWGLEEGWGGQQLLNWCRHPFRGEENVLESEAEVTQHCVSATSHFRRDNPMSCGETLNA